MENNNLYLIYGALVSSNIILPLKTEPILEYATPNITIEADISKKFKTSPPFFIKKRDESWIVNFQKSYYHIEPIQGKIFVRSDSIYNVWLSIFNIPFSLLMFNNENLILHSCSYYLNDELLIFLADKGVGKSTFLQKALRSGATFFSDDSLLLKKHYEKIEYYPANQLFKLTQNSQMKFKSNLDKYAKMIWYDELREKNIYLLNEKPKYNCEPKACKIYQICRSNEIQKMIVHKITDLFVKKKIVIHNVVGIKHFNYNMLYMLYNSDILNSIATTIDFYSLQIPNNIDYEFDIKVFNML